MCLLFDILSSPSFRTNHTQLCAETGEQVTTTNGTGYQMIQSLISGLGYIDGDVTASTYYYVATTYDSGTNTESGYSNQITVNIPN